MDEKIYHVSETSGIARFEPRADLEGRMRVWAIGESRLHNYLLPRDCPRVTYYAKTTTSIADRRAFFSVSDTQSIIAIEQAWLPAICSIRLHLYEFPAHEFSLDDAIAGYYVSSRSVVPISHRDIQNPLTELFERNVELRVVSSLWPLNDAVVGSTLGFSMIRMRNAGPRNALTVST